MPIIPRYDFQGGGLPTIRPVVLSADPNAGQIAGVLSKAGAAAADIAGAYDARRLALEEKRQKLADTTLMAQRTVQAETELDATLDGIQRTPTAHGQAVEVYQQEVDRLSKEWVKGLRPDQAAAFQKVLTSQIIAGRKTARDLQNKFEVGNAQATLDSAEQAAIDQASRLDRTDDRAFEWSGPYKDYLDALVSTNLLEPQAAEKRRQKTLSDAAYARLQRMTVSDNPAAVQRAIDVVKNEEGSAGSTFASHIEPKHRNELLKSAQGQLHTLKLREREDDDRARVERERAIKDQQDATERAFNEVLDAGKLTKYEVTIAARDHLLPPNKQEYYYKAIDNANVEGQDDPAVARSLRTRVFDIRQDPIKVQDDVQRAYVNNQLSRSTAQTWLSHLQAWRQHTSDQYRAEGQQMLHQRHQNVQQLIHDTLAVNGDPMIQQLAQPVIALAREQLGRESAAMRPNGVDPQDWWDRNKIRFMSLVGQNAVSRVNAERNLLPPSLRQIQQVDDLKSDPVFQKAPREQQMEMYQRAKGLLDLEQATKSLIPGGGASSAPQNTPGTSQGSAAARKGPSVGVGAPKK